MSARVVISCDGHRFGQPCRGALFARSDHRGTAIGQAYRAGWDYRSDVGDLCPSGSHDEDAFTCPRCGRRSWNPNDVAEGYCGACHDWTGQPHDRSP